MAYNISVVEAVPEGDVRLQVDNDGEIEEDEADHEVLVDSQTGTAERSEGAEDVHADKEEKEADDGETEVGVGHYDGEVAAVPDEVDVGETLRVVGSSAPVSSCRHLLTSNSTTSSRANMLSSTEEIVEVGFNISTFLPIITWPGVGWGEFAF